MILLIIKGSPDQARDAMQSRGMDWNDSFVRVGVETHGRCQAKFASAVANWMAETMLAPFPPGSLLFFSHLSNSNREEETVL